MKKIEAVIRPHQLDAVKQALFCLGLKGMSVYEVLGCGRQHGYIEFYSFKVPQSPDKIELIPKVKIELVVMDEQVDAVIETIQKIAYTGQIGDGKIFVIPVERAIRIRTKEQDEAAI